MKNKVLFSAILGILSVYSANATTYYLNGSQTVSGTTAFKDAAFWVDKDGIPSGGSGEALDPTADYVMTNSLRQTRGDAYAHFGGSSLRIGESSALRPHFMQYYNEETSFDKLYFTSGYYVGNRGHDMTYKLTADITVDSAPGNDFVMSLSYTNSKFNVTGSLSSGENSCLSLCTISPAYKKDKQTDYGIAYDDSWNTFIFNTDLSSFFGTLKLGRTTDEQLTATPSKWQIKALFPQSTKLQGSVIVPSYDVLAVSTSVTFTVKNLTLNAGSMLEFESFYITAPGSITVSDNLALNGPIGINICSGMLPTSGGRFTILSAPNTEDEDVPFTIDDFSLITSWRGAKPELAVEVDETTNTRKLILVTQRWLPDNYITLRKSDTASKDYKNENEAQLHSALTNAAYWSNSAIPDNDHDYYVGPTDITMNEYALRTRSDITTDTFAGRSLTIGNNGLLFIATSTMTFNDLRLLDGAILACPNSGNATVKGSISVPWGSVRLRQYVRRTLNVAGTVIGEAELMLEGWDRTGSATGFYSFKNADMTGFKGTIRISEHPGMLCTDYSPAGTNQTLNVDSTSGETQLGGKLDSFNPKALTIERNGTLELNAGSTLNITTNYNRGIYINGNGRLKMQSAWHTLNISTRLTVNGTLVKDGEGTLVLRGECVAEGVVPTLDITTNDVVVASANSINGLSVLIGTGASLKLKANPEDEELSRYGIRMEKSEETPFVLKEGTSKIPLALDCSAMTRPDSAIELGICTVSSEAADDVEAMLPAFTSPFPRMSATLIRTTDDDSRVTFALKLAPKGFTLTFR